MVEAYDKPLSLCATCFCVILKGDSLLERKQNISVVVLASIPFLVNSQGGSAIRRS